MRRTDYPATLARVMQDAKYLLKNAEKADRVYWEVTESRLRQLRASGRRLGFDVSAIQALLIHMAEKGVFDEASLKDWETL